MLEKFLDKYFPKKFKVRALRQCAYGCSDNEDGYYYIQYAYYRFFCRWKSIRQFLTTGVWNDVMYRPSERERIDRVASSFKSIEDVIDFYKEQRKKEAIYLQRPRAKAPPYIIHY